MDFARLAHQLKQQSAELGLADCRVSTLDPGPHADALRNWLSEGHHADMTYMADRADLRCHPEQLRPGSLRCISVRLEYWPESDQAEEVLNDKGKAYISRYALGRDYHKVLRQRLKQLGQYLQEHLPGSDYRVFVDSAPVLERGFAQLAGLGWIGKNTMLIHPRAGSYFFLGEIFTDAPLPLDPEFETTHCGSCTRCLDLCPTQAFPAPFVLDSRRCISYLTIENRGRIPEELREPMGNRVFGCDDCQLVCPWNKFARHTVETDFKPRHGLQSADLCELFLWSEEEFLKRTEGSPIRRTGYVGWLRNLAVGLGNAPTSERVVTALKQRLEHPSELVQEHVRWALSRHTHP